MTTVAIRNRDADSLPGDWSNLVVFCAGTSWDGNKFPDQHMAERLTRFAPVMYVDPPLSARSARRNPVLARSLERPRLRLLRPGLARLTPLSPPGMSRVGIRSLSEWLRVRAIRRAVAQLGGTVQSVVIASLAPLYGSFPDAKHVLYGTDDFVAGAALMGLSERWLRNLERRQLEASDLVVAVSPILAQRWQEKGHQVALVPNGCENEAFRFDFSDVPPDIAIRPPIVGFVGHISARIDIAYFEAIAERGISLLLVGPWQKDFAVSRMSRLLAQPNVQWVGAKPFDELPRYVGAFDVGIVPYADSEFNRGSFPLKTLEYLAAGARVVASDLPSIRWLDTPLVSVGSGPVEFADAVSSALASRPTLEERARRRAFAAQHSWEKRAAQFAVVTGLCMDEQEISES